MLTSNLLNIRILIQSLMENLITQVKSCTLCEAILPMPPKPILQLSKNSKILIAGQAPGAVTHQKGIPFDDMSGDRLRSWLGVSKAQFYNPELFSILPMSFCYPGKGKSGDLPPPALCASTWRNSILAHCKNIELTIVLGKYAVKWHLNSTDSISTHAQNWQNLLNNNTIVLPHPSPRNNIWLKKHSWFESQVVPALKKRVNAIIPC